MRAPTILLFLFLAVISGWGSAIYSVDAMGSASVAGSSGWRIWETDSDDATGHYALAHYLMRGAVPPADALMKSYFAMEDADGKALDSSCRYAVSLPRLNVRWWSLSTATERAQGIALTSDTAMAKPDGTVDIAMSQQPQSGNWLRSEDGGGFSLRLLATQDGRNQDGELPLPKIVKAGC
jgi:hypothetical protein